MAARSFLYGGDSGGGAGGGGGGSGFNSVLLTNKRAPCSSSKPLDSFFVSGSSHSFAGSRSMVSFEEGGNGSGRSFFQTIDHQEDINGDDEYDDYFQHPEKKRRLKSDQVVFLEKSFETDNKLEPDRKIQLAKDLGLQPRQIAIWFQNRRARWKTKQLEKDYDLLQQSFNDLKQNYENLLQEKEKLKSEVHDLSDKLLLRETEKGACDDSSSTKSPSEPLQQEQGADCLNDEDVGVKSDSTESRSPGYVELLERGDSSYNLFQVREYQSDESLEEEDKLGKMFVTPVSGCYMLPKMESGGGDYPEIDAVNSSYIGFHGHGGDEDQDQDQEQPFGFWSFTELTRID